MEGRQAGHGVRAEPVVVEEYELQRKPAGAWGRGWGEPAVMEGSREVVWEGLEDTRRGTGGLPAPVAAVAFIPQQSGLQSWGLPVPSAGILARGERLLPQRGVGRR